MNKRVRAHRFPDEYYWLALLALVLVSLPGLGSLNALTILTMANIWAVFALSWDILSGYTGQISFGHAFFIGLGGYASALLSVTLAWPLPLTILAGGCVAALGGFLLALLTTRLHGPYLSLVTLVAALGTEKIIRLLKIQSTGAEGAIIGFKPLVGFEQGLEHFIRTPYFYSTSLLLAVALVLVALARSRIGKVFVALRESEQATEAAGLNTTKYKLLAFVVSGLIAGVGGAFYAHYQGSVSPASHFALEISIFCIVASVIGGMGTVVGPIAGAFIYKVPEETLRFLGNWRYFALAALALAVLYFLPKGFLTEVRLLLFRGLQRLRRRKRESSTVP